MAKKPDITSVESGYTAQATINDNFDNLRNGFDNTLSLDGSTPNAMNADLDMNSNDILNAESTYTTKLYIGGTLLVPGDTTSVLLEVVQEYATVAALRADTATFTNGDYVRVLEGGFYYKATASGDITNGGGQDWDVLPLFNSSVYHLDAWGPDKTGGLSFVTYFNEAIAKVHALTDGGVVLVGGGTFLWDSKVTLERNVHIRGAGVGVTKFNVTGTGIMTEMGEVADRQLAPVGEGWEMSHFSADLGSNVTIFLSIIGSRYDKVHHFFIDGQDNSGTTGIYCSGNPASDEIGEANPDPVVVGVFYLHLISGAVIQCETNLHLTGVNDQGQANSIVLDGVDLRWGVVNLYMETSNHITWNSGACEAGANTTHGVKLGRFAQGLKLGSGVRFEEVGNANFISWYDLPTFTSGTSKAYTRSGSTITLTHNLNDSLIKIGDSVAISNASDAQIANGNYTVTGIPSANVLTFEDATAVDASGTLDIDTDSGLVRMHNLSPLISGFNADLNPFRNAGAVAYSWDDTTVTITHNLNINTITPGQRIILTDPVPIWGNLSGYKIVATTPDNNSLTYTSDVQNPGYPTPDTGVVHFWEAGGFEWDKQSVGTFRGSNSMLHTSPNYFGNFFAGRPGEGNVDLARAPGSVFATDIFKLNEIAVWDSQTPIEDGFLGYDSASQGPVMRVNSFNSEVMIRVPVAGPAGSSSATGRRGWFAVDNSYLYVCISTDTWGRIALSTGW